MIERLSSPSTQAGTGLSETPVHLQSALKLLLVNTCDGLTQRTEIHWLQHLQHYG